MSKKMIFPVLRALLFFGLTIAASPLSAQQDYRVTGVTFSQTVTANQFVRVSDNLTVSWTAPAGVDPAPMNYYLKFSESSVPLTSAELNDTNHDFSVTHPGNFVSISKSFFDLYNSDKLRFLHITTQYLDTATGKTAYSTALVVGPIRIDNVAPTGKLTLDPAAGTTKQVGVSMSPSEPIKFYWLNDATIFPGGAGTDYSFFPQGVVNLRDGTPYGNVTIAAWFEDFAGNRTTAPSAQAVYNYIAPVAINHNNIFQINVGATLGFTVDATTTYNWTLTDMAAGVAEFVGSSSGVPSVTVKGLKAGTFTVTATPTTGTALKTGTITVLQSYTRGDVNNDGNIDSGDAILVLRYSVGLTALTDIQKAAGNVTAKASNDLIDSGDAIRILRYSVGLIDVL